jgi:hypothetical protein
MPDRKGRCSLRSMLWVLRSRPALVFVWLMVPYCGYGTSRLPSVTVALFRSEPGNTDGDR